MLFFISCNSTPKNYKQNQSAVNTGQELIKYAKGFSIIQNDSNRILCVKNPWQHASNVKFTYTISSDSLQHPDIKTPLQRVVCLSTTHLAYLDELGVIESVVGVSNSQFVNNKTVQQNIKKGYTKDIGNDQALDYEQILKLKPDAIFTYGVGPEVQATYQKFKDWGIPVIIIGEYLEHTPLGKAEWIKFFACFYHQENRADTIFNQVAKQYQKLAQKVNQKKNRPLVLTSFPWKDVWYVPGGKSFMANFIKDAGGYYLWADDDSHESLALSIESVFHHSKNAKIWIHVGRASSLEDVKQADPRMAQLKPYINRQVYNNNKRQNKFGGNDFWESGCVNPQLILADLIRIFHPDCLPDSSFNYYVKLQ